MSIITPTKTDDLKILDKNIIKKIGNASFIRILEDKKASSNNIVIKKIQKKIKYEYNKIINLISNYQKINKEPIIKYKYLLLEAMKFAQNKVQSIINMKKDLKNNYHFTLVDPLNIKSKIKSLELEINKNTKTCVF